MRNWLIEAFVRNLALAGLWLSALYLLISCVAVGQKPTPAATQPVDVVGARGALAPERSAAVLKTAIAASPDPAAMHRLESLMETVSSEPLFKDNEVRLLVDGPDTYAEMLKSIEAARATINLETYIFNEDEVGLRFADALIRRSREGIEVRVIYDSLGSRTSSTEFFDRMRDAGIELVEFNPVNPLEGGNPLDMNVRDHRKLLVVDGLIAFTGGINLDRNYSSSSALRRRSRPARAGWRDTHIAVEGPAVAGFQRLFLRNWAESRGEAAGEDDVQRYFPPARAKGTDLVRVLSAVGGDDTVSPIRVAYGYAMEEAAQRIWITQSYFAPDADFLKTMSDAARRGIDVRIIVTGETDAPMLLHISRSCYGELLKAGVRVYESEDVMLHAKTAVIDGIWSTVGSSNLDYRSFIHNHEVNAVVVGEKFGRTMETLFESDMKRSREITLEEWRNRPWLDRIKEQLSRLAQYWL
jgi:cardiolipin synthase A/B